MGKQLIIIGADFSSVAIGTAKVLDHITASISGTQYTNSAPTGLTVTAYYTAASGGGSSVVTGYTTSPAVWGSTAGQQTMTISYTRGGITKTAIVTATVQEGGGTTYTVTANITNGTAASTSVASGGTATLTVTPNSGYSNPTSATVTSGTAGTPTVSSNIITVPNVTSNVTIAATCPAGGVLTWYIETPSSAGTSSAGNNSNGWGMATSATTIPAALVNVPINRFRTWVSNNEVIGQTVYFAVYNLSTKAKVSEQSIVITSDMYNNGLLTVPITTVTLSSSQALIFQPSDKVDMANQSWAIKFGNGSAPSGFISRVPTDISGSSTAFRYNGTAINFGYGYQS